MTINVLRRLENTIVYSDGNTYGTDPNGIHVLMPYMSCVGYLVIDGITYDLEWTDLDFAIGTPRLV